MNKWCLNLLTFLLAHVTLAQQSYDVTFDHDGKTVNATFSVPAGNGPFPTIVINPGSGANDRQGTIAMTDGNTACLFPQLYGSTLHIYKELSDAMVKAGYAVLRYDKLEYTYPTTLDPITFHKLWLPVESAVNYLKTRSDVDVNQLILIGHSEGSSLIPYIAKKRNDIRAMISIAGPRTPFDSIYAWQEAHLVELLRPCGATSADSTDAANEGNQVLTYFNVIRTNTWNAGTPKAFGVPASAWYDYIHVIDSVSDNYNATSIPTLFTGMGSDIQVPPVELDRFRQEVTGNTDFWSIPGLIHYMVPDNDPHVSKVLTDTLIYWLRQQGFTAGITTNYLDDASVQVQPNPVSNQFTLSIQNPGVADLGISLRTVTGAVVLAEQYETVTDHFTHTFTTEKFPAGVYFLTIHTDSGTITQKVVKE